jgi:tetratricopeptide (TPR) repeat protein
MKLDRYDGYNYLRYGMCLDWLGEQNKSGEKFSMAEALDPNGYYTVAYIGWHYFQTGDYAAAKAWFERSLRLNGGKENVIAHSYLALVQQKLAEKASGKGLLPAGF